MARLFIVLSLVLGVVDAANRLVERRVQADADFLQIIFEMGASEDNPAEPSCGRSEEALMKADIDAFIRGLLFGDFASNEDVCTIVNTEPHCTPGQWCPRGYTWTGAAPCRNCGRDNRDNRRMLATPAEIFSDRLKADIEATLVPKHRECLGAAPYIKIDVRGLSSLQEGCRLRPQVDPPPSDPSTEPRTVGDPPTLTGDPCDSKKCHFRKEVCVVNDTGLVATCVPVRPWWKHVKANFDKSSGNVLKKCIKRGTTPPQNGRKCGTTSKTCFFGTQQCPIVSTYPVTKCTCVDKKWACDEDPLVCPKSADESI